MNEDYIELSLLFYSYAHEDKGFECISRYLSAKIRMALVFWAEPPLSLGDESNQA